MMWLADPIGLEDDSRAAFHVSIPWTPETIRVVNRTTPEGRPLAGLVDGFLARMVSGHLYL